MKIAIVRLSALGDIIQSAAVLQFIKKFKKDIEIHWFVDIKFEGILKNHPLIDKLYALPLKDKKILKSLKILLNARKNHYDAVMDLQGLIKSSIVSRILSKNNFGFDKASLKESFAHNFYNQKLSIDYNENVFVRYLSLASFMLNTDFSAKDLAFKQDVFKINNNLKEALNEKLQLDKNKQNILIHVGSSVENKIYPKTKLAILCKLLINEFQKAKIWLAWGNTKEHNFAKEVLNLSAIDEIHISLAPKFNLEELMAFTKMMNLIIGNDSGPTHLAFALNKPSITIFGATPSHRNAFKTNINKIIDAGKKIQDAKHIDKSDFCITLIEEEDIFKLAKSLLNEK
ncbi:lipopolysaccharide heptosyltransferase I [Campylobacter hepaticus]|uniref:Lipopolysaccharide heptosyltransferase 1 n=1 Tax=Campylobacter hepaticus TaxID=1813019 RepID=A0A424Z248_9BACT|nr:lipopolysaccharide heptosyltransferase I [Campylobacter hepaticus]MCZ0772212.1 lipopolysaccharide heptosyltransferase I [Campylobacter hepaticus]MCZ0773680.1 lipopolysaccharide heptosyltransferase I [Campylobacter hepaticus]MCZ0774931.1 lipopolysaccharide heptosyltransferase I [Campylobacter hepaticus]MDX2322799.1 lipopolysaccharide heptosyltransferase I [Campylobacter hepaticus]MDX2331899.1 lipopolysaccharide heptosyltransferase I [Campylobacter hepaticus]